MYTQCLAGISVTVLRSAVDTVELVLVVELSRVEPNLLHTYAHTYTYACIHVHAYTHTHTYAYAYTHVRRYV